MPIGNGLPSPSGNSRDQMVSCGASKEKWKLLQNFSKKGWSTAQESEQEDGLSQNMKTDLQRSWAFYNYPGVKIGQEFWQSCHKQNLLSQMWSCFTPNMVLLQKKYLILPSSPSPQNFTDNCFNLINSKISLTTYSVTKQVLLHVPKGTRNKNLSLNCKCPLVLLLPQGY